MVRLRPVGVFVGFNVDLSDGRGESRRERAALERAVATEKCIVAARVVLREHSVFDLSASVVARVAGLTRQTVYKYFPTMRQLVFALADELTVGFQKAGVDLDVEGPDWPRLYVDAVVDLLLADPIPNRQVILVSASQGRGMAAATAGTSREILPVMEMRNPVEAERAAWLTLTLFRGTLFTWAAEQLSDEALRADLRKVADVVVAQREIWNTATSGSGEA
jgi:AcrR family transcriptional regulator